MRVKYPLSFLSIIIKYGQRFELRYLRSRAVDQRIMITFPLAAE